MSILLKKKNNRLHMLEIRYFGFWPSFYTSHTNSLKTLFQYLFEGLKTTKEIHVHSVFPHNILEPKDTNVINVSFSGESYFDDPSKYDVNLIMQSTDLPSKVVYCPLFSIGSTEYGFWEQYMQTRQYTEKQRFCAFVVSNPTAMLRNTFFALLNSYKRVDSCGAALNNCGGWCAPKEHDIYFKFLNQFKFMICFEHTSNPYYITEKLHNAWLGGTIPIYWGCKQATTFLNPNAFLYLEDESNEAIERLIHKIIELDNDNAKYMEMYNEPLIIGNQIPHELDIEKIRNKIHQVLVE
jgi:hypothetical protein